MTTAKIPNVYRRCLILPHSVGLIVLALACSSTGMAQGLPQGLSEELGFSLYHFKADGQASVRVSYPRFRHRLLVEASRRDGELERIGFTEESVDKIREKVEQADRRARLPREELVKNPAEILDIAEEEIKDGLTIVEVEDLTPFLLLRKILLRGALRALSDSGYLEADQRAAQVRILASREELLKSARQHYRDAILRLFEGADTEVLNTLTDAFSIEGNWIPNPGLLHSCLLYDLEPIAASPSSHWKQSEVELCLDFRWRLRKQIPYDAFQWSFDMLRSANVDLKSAIPRIAMTDLINANMEMRSELTPAVRKAFKDSDRQNLLDEYSEKTISAIEDILSLLPELDQKKLKLARFRTATLEGGPVVAIRSQSFVELFGSKWTEKDARKLFDLNRDEACEVLGEGGAKFYSEWLDIVFPESRYLRIREELPSAKYFRANPFPSEIILNPMFQR